MDRIEQKTVTGEVPESDAPTLGARTDDETGETTYWAFTDDTETIPPVDGDAWGPWTFARIDDDLGPMLTLYHEHTPDGEGNKYLYVKTIREEPEVMPVGWLARLGLRDLGADPVSWGFIMAFIDMDRHGMIDYGYEDGLLEGVDVKRLIDDALDDHL